MGADYSIELISIETYAAQFIWHNNFFLGSVNDVYCLIYSVFDSLFFDRNDKDLHKYVLF